MEEELKSLIKVGVTTIISLSYCYFLPLRIKCGVFRLVSIFPVLAMFLFLPLIFSFSIFSSAAAFSLSTVANLRLFLFAFDEGPLFPLPSNLFLFICFTCFPFHRQQNPKPKHHFPKCVFTIKVAIFSVLSHVYTYRENLPPTLLLGLLPLYLYLALEILFTPLRIQLSIILGCDLEPYFNEPYLATSLQDFWGYRWNLMVSSILRLGIYNPVRRVCGYIMNSDYAKLTGLTHELFFFYVTREMPTWEVTLFFVLHGVCTVAEVTVKRTAFVRRWSVRPAVSWLLTMGFINVTASWLFFPQLIRTNVMDRCANETWLTIGFFGRKLFHFFSDLHL